MADLIELALMWLEKEKPVTKAQRAAVHEELGPDIADYQIQEAIEFCSDLMTIDLENLVEEYEEDLQLLRIALAVRSI